LDVIRVNPFNRATVVRSGVLQCFAHRAGVLDNRPWHHYEVAAAILCGEVGGCPLTVGHGGGAVRVVELVDPTEWRECQYPSALHEQGAHEQQEREAN
jgi:hypothetical protein